jgi:hypothetical protein
VDVIEAQRVGSIRFRGLGVSDKAKGLGFRNWGLGLRGKAVV